MYILNMPQSRVIFLWVNGLNTIFTQKSLDSFDVVVDTHIDQFESFSESSYSINCNN